MSMRGIVVTGAGGHAAVVADAIRCGGDTVLAFADADLANIGSSLQGAPIIDEARLEELFDRDTHLLANGIGGVRDTALRRCVQERLERNGWRFTTIRHPAAIVSARATVADGVQMLAGCIVQAGACIGRGAILNSGAIVEHYCTIGEWTHLAPAATVCGDVTIGAGSIVGARAVVIQGIRIGAEALIGAGAVVVRDFEGGGMLYGVPARPIRTKA